MESRSCFIFGLLILVRLVTGLRQTISTPLMRRQVFEDFVLASSVTTTSLLIPNIALADDDDDDAVQVLKRRNSEVWLIGTAHVSARSAEQVAETIDAVSPDLIAIELDRKRISQVAASSEQTSETPKQQKPQLGAFAIGAALRSMYSSLDKMGFDSGAEFSVALDKASSGRIPVLLADQDVDTTLSRLAYAVRHTKPEEIAALDSSLNSVLSKNQGIRLLTEATSNYAGTKSGEGSRDILREAVELIKHRDTVRNVIQALKSDAPQLYSALVDERDATMANNLIQVLDSPVPPKRVVFVVGMAHEDGIARRLYESGFRDDDDRRNLVLRNYNKKKVRQRMPISDENSKKIEENKPEAVGAGRIILLNAKSS
uniref:TraB family protein n=1 Tax=Aureoumbra lagunensis TaxID=44058 RepID=A0A7S3JSX9_9STRA|mmetsp:Transcript_11480/g.15682  ORF Transcript_11480/g.15682 Transcript_11480/m.15682 type:complete len:372 (+) Transcript_11480:109-1224(+)